MGNIDIRNWERGFVFRPKNPATDFEMFDNVRIDGDMVKPRYGRFAYPVTGLLVDGYPVNGLYLLDANTGSLQIFLGFKSLDAWKSALNFTTGSWTKLTGSAGTYNNTYSYDWRFAEFIDTVGETVIAVNGIDAAQEFYFDTTVSFANLKIRNLAGSPPVAYYVCEFNAYMFMARNDTYANRLWWSNFDNPRIWTGSDARDVGSGSRITGIFQNGTGLLIAKEDSFYVLESGIPLEVPLSCTVKFQGCKSPKSMIKIKDQLFYYWGNKIFIYPTQDIVELQNDSIKNPQNIVLSHQERDNLLMIACCTSGTYNNQVYYMDLKTGMLSRDLGRSIFISIGQK